MEAVIIDDERLARDELKTLLKEHSESINIVGEATNGEEGIKLIQKMKPQLVFLDIQMPGMDGFEMIRNLEVIPHCIFVSAYDEYAIEAFKVNALDYLLKPVDENLLKKAIEKVRAKIEEDEEFLTSIEHTRDQRKLTINDRVFIKDREKCFFPNLSEIIYFESQGNYVRVYFDKNKPMILRSLNALEENLSPNDFFRANRKYIINIHHIKSIENWFNGGLKIKLSNDVEIEVSRRQAIRFKEFMTL